MRSGKEAAMDEIFVETIILAPSFRQALREILDGHYAPTTTGQYPDGSLHVKYRVLPDDAPSLASPEEAG